MDPDGDLVYGAIHDYLIFMPRAEAARLAAVRRAVDMAHTWGELKLAMPTASYLHLIERLRENHDDEDLPPYWEPDISEAFTAEDIPGFADGDWPEWPAQDAVQWIPTDVQQRYGHIEDSVLNGEYLEMHADQEQEILAALHRHGYTAERDDALIQRAYGIA